MASVVIRSHAGGSLSEVADSLKASFSEPLKARSLAALLAASPSTTTTAAAASTSASNACSDCSFSGDDSDTSSRARLALGSRSAKLRNARCVLHKGGRNGFPLSSGDELSTDSGDESLASASYGMSSVYDDASILSGDDSSVVHWVDGTGSDAEDEEELMTSTSAVAGPRVYPLSALLRFRSAACDAPAAALGYGAEHLPPVVDAKTKSTDLHSVWEPSPVCDHERVTRLSQALLDALPSEKTDALFDRLVVRGIKTPSQFGVAIGEVLEYGAAHHQFISECVDLCVRFKADPRLRQTIGVDGGPQSFRQTLLNWCWPVFEQLLSSGESAVAAVLDQSSSCHRSFNTKRHRAMGCIKLLSCFIMRDIVSPRLAVECAEALLASYSPALPDMLEPLAVLMQVTGPKLDAWKDWVHARRLREVFLCIRTILSNATVPLQQRAFLQDLCTLQDCGWSSSAAALSIRQAAVLQGAPGLEPSTKLRQDVDSAIRRAVAPSEQTPPMLSLARSVLLAPADAPSHHHARGIGAVPGLKKALRGGSTTASVDDCASTAALSDASRRVSSGSPSSLESSGASRSTSSIASDHSASDASSGSPSLVQTAPRAMERPEWQACVGEASLAENPGFCPKAFRKELSATLTDLRVTGNVAAAVRRVRAQNVPFEQQEREYVDLLTRASEYTYKPARRSAFAFAAGLAAAQPSAFDRNACLAGVRVFFDEVYGDLREEVPKLPVIMRVELLPTLRTVLPAAAIDRLLPKDLELPEERRVLGN